MCIRDRVNPAVLLEEIDMFEGDGISTANLKVSGNCLLYTSRCV